MLVLGLRLVPSFRVSKPKPKILSRPYLENKEKRKLNYKEESKKIEKNSKKGMTA